MAFIPYAMQPILSGPVASISSTSSGNEFCTPTMYISSPRKNSSLRVWSMAEKKQKEQPATQVTPPTMSPEEQKQQPPTPVTPPPLPQYPRPLSSTRSGKLSTRFINVMAFDGPAPERINGRLAMIGFVSAIAVELAKGQDLFEQLSNGGIAWFIGTSVVFSIASLIPLLRGVSVESTSGRIVTSEAELWNGRFAMLGIVALAFTEYVKGGPLV